ncbi:MAG TPA: beta-galactosidase GalB, partial [Balneolaceae bacterium]|nr:beta-galactosidase GalB [Balneolaceae bacterium]
MKRKEFIDSMVLGSLGFLGAGAISSELSKKLRGMKSDTRNRSLFDQDWKFHLGDVKQAQDPGFNDHSWRKLNLPHDWSIEGQFSKDAPAGVGGGALPGGIGWYRKSFTLPQSKQGKRIFIEFYGVYENSDVWINGHHLGNRPYGYSTFRYDMTPFLKYGSKSNEIAVRVNNSKQPNSRWYSGSGIYRHVWLIETNNVHVDQWGTYITTPLINDEAATVSIQTHIKNEESTGQNVTLRTTIYDPNGQKVGEDSQKKSVAGGSVGEVPQYISVSDPILWSTEHPNLYKAVSIIENDGEQVDRYETTFGIRYFRFDADSGFYLNGEPLKIRGMCDHHNVLGPLGSAQNDRAIQRRLQLLKDMGCNAFRTSHNPPTPELLDLADRMGFLVMDEAFDCWDRGKVKYDYHIYWDQWHKRDLEDLIRRDRNHPSVILWSIGNEIPEQWHPKGREIALELAGIAKNFDQTRPITSACNHPQPDNYIIKSGALDVIGINYHHQEYSNLQEMFPGKKFIGSETTSALQTRGHYDMPADKIRVWPTKNHKNMNDDYTCSSYDNCRVPWGATHEANWKAVDKYDYMSGMFGWTGFDYLGEPTPYGWPARSSYFGILDLCGMPKDAYYFYQSQWTDKPMLHLLPHWNWNEGQKIDVWAYSNCDEVELFLNGKSQGSRYFDRGNLHLSWQVPFSPGMLKAVGKKNGKEVVTDTVRTAGKPSSIHLDPDRKTIQADGRDLSFVAVSVTDDQGILVPHADELVHFDIKGPGSIDSIGNGHEISHESFKKPQHKVFNGKCMAIVRS